MKILYFAWVREKIGKTVEEVSPPENVTDVAALIDWLKGRGEGYGEAFADESVVRVAVNQEYVSTTQSVSEGDEVAFFPPVTGG